MARVVLGAMVVLMSALAAVSPAAAQVPAADADGGGSVVAADVRDVIDDGPALVVVALDTPAVAGRSAGAGTSAAIASVQDQVIASLPARSVEDVHRFEHVPALAMMVSDSAAIDALENTPGVRKVDLDVGGTGHLNVTVPLTGANERHAVGNEGDGVVVAVIDSGIDSDHPDLINDNILGGQACFGFNLSAPGSGFCPDGSDLQFGSGSAEDDAGHGTHVSGIVSSDGSVSSPGFAPGAETLALKATDNCSFGGCFYSFTLNVVAALDYIIDNPQLDVKVINMSLGTGTHFAGDCDNATSWTMAGAAAINTLRSSGVVAFASAGNDGSAQMGAPACLSNVISVGASTDGDLAASFTDASATTDIFGPGVGVISDAIGGSTVSASGTSMASPSAAGCAALLVESGEATSPDAIEARLESSTTTILAANSLRYPRIDCGRDDATVLASPCLIHDSTAASGGFAGPIGTNTTRTVTVTGALPAAQGGSGSPCVPEDATSVVVTLSALAPSGVGNFRLSEAGVTANGGVVNYAPNGLNNATTVTVPVSDAGQLDIFANAAPAGVRMSVQAYYGNGQLQYFPVTPCAAADSRAGSGGFSGPFAAGANYPDVDVVGGFSSNQGGDSTNCAIPSGADAVMVNLVAVRPTPGGFNGAGFLAAAPGGSNPSERVTPFANLAINNATSTIVPLNGGQTIAIDIEQTSGTPSSHVRVVVLGYFDTSGGASFSPVNPCAAFDSRSGTGSTFGGKRTAGTSGVNLTGVTSYQIAGSIPAAQGGLTNCSVPAGADAVLINLVAIQPDAVGNFRAYAAGSTPTGGVLNFAPLTPAMNNSNAVVVPLNGSGSLDLFVNAPSNNGNPTVHARGVVLGYYN